MQHLGNQENCQFAVEVFGVPGPGWVKIAEEYGYQEDGKQEYDHDIDGGDDTKLNQDGVARHDEGGKSGSCREGGQECGIAGPLNYAAQGFDLVAMQPVFMMEFIKKEDAVFNPDNDKQWGYNPG